MTLTEARAIAEKIIKEAENSSEPYDMVDHIAQAILEGHKAALERAIKLLDSKCGYLHRGVICCESTRDELIELNSDLKEAQK